MCHTARHLGATLNGRRDPSYEQRMLNDEQNDEQRMLQHEQRMKRLKSEIEQIEKETEQLRRENARLRQLNDKGRALLSCVDQHCFPPESNSNPPNPTEPDCGPSSP